MKNARWLIAVAGLIAVSWLVWWFVAGRDRTPSADATGREGAAAPAMAGHEGMNMAGDGTVTLTTAQVQQFGVTFGTVEERPLESAVRTTGIVTVDETRVARVVPKVGGFIERVQADFTGQRVRRGEALVELYSPDLLAAQEELLLAARLDSGVLTAARQRLRLLDVPEAQIDEVLSTGRARRTVTLVAPASGVVTEKLVVQGQSVAAGATLYTIADLSRVWIEAEVRETDAAMLKPGLGAEIEMAGEPGRTMNGRIEFVYPIVDPATRTVRARIAVANTAGALRPGAYVTVRLSAPSRRVLTVPASAVVNTGERSLVFVDMGGGQLMPHVVTTGRVAGELVEILSGAESGQRVVTSAQYLLESESNLADVMRAMLGHK